MASTEAAAASAAYEVLSSLNPSFQDLLNTKLDESLAQIPDGKSKTDGIAIGRPVAFRDVPGDRVRERMLAQGISPAWADGMLHYFDGVKAGQVFTPTATIADLLGRPARTFDDWLRENAAALRD